MTTHHLPRPRAADKAEAYRQLERELTALLEGERDLVANAANTAALLFEALPDLNWAGFYFARAGGELVLGPFQGRPACVRIPAGRGVCGAAALQRRTLVVPDVHAFPGHIACDAASNSEIVVPLVCGNLHDGELLGVLDLDSPRLARFDEEDRAGLERLAGTFVRSLD
jgi:L-methionine (R)-S-oxide reductase